MSCQDACFAQSFLLCLHALCPALQEAVADTTGAGDAFIGSVLYSLALGLSRPQMLQLASVVAACKCTELGARPGLPARSHLSADLLSAA
jgi:sugar/nucleoside kinase (ribokinase family)